MKFSFIDAASRELEEAVGYYNSQRAGLGDEFRDEVDAALDRIESLPNAWSRVAKRTRMCRTKRFPYAIVYTQRETMTYIVAVMHGARRPGYWKRRLKGLEP